MFILYRDRNRFHHQCHWVLYPFYRFRSRHQYRSRSLSVWTHHMTINNFCTIASADKAFEYWLEYINEHVCVYLFCFLNKIIFHIFYHYLFWYLFYLGCKEFYSGFSWRIFIGVDLQKQSFYDICRKWCYRLIQTNVSYLHIWLDSLACR